MARRVRYLVLPFSVVFLAACGADSPSQPPGKAPASLTSATGISDPELRRVRHQANELLDGSPEAFRQRLADLRGRPIVVNQWASWCGPCRFEFPFFARQAIDYGGRVAFLGVDTRDSRAEAEGFLREMPTPFPHYFDPEAKIARLFKGGRAWPTTAFYGPDGNLAFTHLGAYRDEAQLEEQIQRYALDD